MNAPIPLARAAHSDLLTLSEATEHVAARRDITAAASTWEVRQAIERGELPAFKLRGRIRIFAAELDQWLAGNTRRAPAAIPQARCDPYTPAELTLRERGDWTK